jgi:hypothetical protein
MAGGIVREAAYFGIVVGSRLPPGTGSAQAVGAIENVRAEKTAVVISLGAWIFSMVSLLPKKKWWEDQCAPRSTDRQYRFAAS